MTATTEAENSMTTGAPARRDPAIRLPGSFILTQEGIDYCATHKIPMRQFTAADRRREYGFVWSMFKAAFAQKLVVNGLLKGVDVVATDLVGLRAEIIDATKLIFYGLMYRRFRPALNTLLYNSSVVQKFNRSNPKRRIGEDLRFSPERVQAFMDTNARAIRALKAGLLFGPFAEIASDRSLDERQKQEMKLIARAFVDRIEDRTWFLFHHLSRSGDKFQLVRSIGEVLMRFVRKTAIVDYAAFMIMELVQLAEKEHYVNLASRDNLSRGPNADVQRLLTDAEFRERLKRNAKQNGFFLTLSYRFDKEDSSPDGRIRFSVSVSHRGRLRESKRRSLQDQTGAKVSSRPLSDLYQEGGGVEAGGLGLFYLSYLEEVCRAEDMRLESRILSDVALEQTSAHVGFTF